MSCGPEHWPSAQGDSGTQGAVINTEHTDCTLYTLYSVRCSGFKIQLPSSILLKWEG